MAKSPEEMAASMIRNLEEKTGKKVQFFPVQSNAAQIEAMRSRREKLYPVFVVASRYDIRRIYRRAVR